MTIPDRFNRGYFFFTGRVGIALNINFYLPATNQIADADAAERALQFMVNL